MGEGDYDGEQNEADENLEHLKDIVVHDYSQTNSYFSVKFGDKTIYVTSLVSQKFDHRLY